MALPFPECDGRGVHVGSSGSYAGAGVLFAKHALLRPRDSGLPQKHYFVPAGYQRHEEPRAFFLDAFR